MRYLKDAKISGFSNDVAAVRNYFGNIYFGDADDLKNCRFLVARFQNLYNPVRPVGPLYCLVPDGDIRSIWPDDIKRYKDIKYGTSSKMGSCEKVTPAIVFQLPNGIGLYFCLTPKGFSLQDEDNFGI